MSRHHKINANTRYAFISIALMVSVFLIFAGLMMLPLGLNGQTRVNLIRLSLYSILLFAAAGGVFSIRVAWLRKKSGVLP
ncbi:cytochrome b6 [Neisseria sicca]|uniref:cytochrome b6 n=1 Tax=Neisseria sicca TaxID=490 RepID=UPI0028802313|nr:cytochrome b6 [Neisseria sicca]